ncbi:MAG: MOSC domain-containing protein [Acidobacteriota bacterium]
MAQESKNSQVVALQLCVGHRQPMKRVATVTALQDFGLEGDRHACAGSRRQVLLIEEETLHELALSYGEVKENITTRGIALMNLTPGQRLRLGDSVEIEITQVCDPCARMEEIRSGLQSRLQGRRGMLGRVIVGGTLQVGDRVEVCSGTADQRPRENASSGLP